MENNLIGKEKYYVHKGTWKNNYERRIEKVKITGLCIDKNNELFVEFSFGCCGYERPLEYLCETLEEAKKLAVKEIKLEKKEQLAKINSY